MAARRSNNIFNFRRLKWGDPKRLEGLKAIGLEEGAPAAPQPLARRETWMGSAGLVLVGLVAGFAIVMSLLGWF